MSGLISQMWPQRVLDWLESASLPTFDQRKREIVKVLRSCDHSYQEESCHQILGGLYLGSARALVESTHLALRDDRYIYRPKEVHCNRHGFQTIISACLTRELIGDCLDLADVDLAQALHPIQWLHVGRTILDEPSLWTAFVHDCTFPDSALARTELPEDIEAYEALNQQKQDAIFHVPPQEWFAPIFAEVDKAVFANHKVLVHCRGGISRSASLLAAYLIRRFHLSVEEAVDFLTKKRACVKPKFMESLQEYVKALCYQPPCPSRACRY